MSFGSRTRKRFAYLGAQIPAAKPRKTPNGIAGNLAEFTLAAQCHTDAIKPIAQNHRFCESRKFDLDLAIPHLKIGIEIQGGIYDGRAHGSISGILRDMEKSNLLTMLGWRVLRFTPEEVRKGVAIAQLKELIECVTMEMNLKTC